MASRYATPCGHYSDEHGYCRAIPTRHYLPGHRCQQHTPAALAGQPEPPQGPGWPRKPALPAADSAGWNAIDARAIASGKRRASLRDYQAARDEIEHQHERDRDARKGH